MELREMVEQAKSGDSLAFDRLVAHYRDMALGYARSLVGAEAAEDAVQEALVVAHQRLDRLEDSGAFVGWLRGIVRHRALHGIKRRSGVTIAELDNIPDLEDLEQSLVDGLDSSDIARAVADLPEDQRAMLGLHYQRGLSHAEIGAKLGISNGTVNMRLHAIRTRLRRRLKMNDETTQSLGTGIVQSAEGALVTLQFTPGTRPKLFSRLTSDRDSLCVVRCLPDGLAQAVVTRDWSIWTAGQEVRDTGEAFLDALPDSVAIGIASRPTYKTTPLLTHIKSIDLFAAMAQGGVTGLFAEWGVGLLVLLPEILHRIDDPGNRQTLYVFVPPILSEAQWREVNAEAGCGSRQIEVIYLPVADPIAPAILNSVTGLDTRLVLSRSLTEQGIYPSIDPIRSRSNVGVRSETAQQVCDLIRRYYTLQFSTDPEAARSLTSQEWAEIRRARLAMRFLSQPFYVAEPYTGISGVDADPVVAEQTFAAILDGRYDGHPVSEFTMAGDSPRTL